MIKKIYKNSLLITVCLFLVKLDSQASDFHSARTAALGGAGHAGPMLNDALLLNPSFTAFLPSYSVGVQWLSYHTLDEITRGKNLQVSIQDGRSDLFQAGVAYTRRNDRTFIHLGAGKALSTDLGIGIGAKYVIDNQTKDATKDAVLSTTWIPIPAIQAALVIDNLLTPKDREVIIGSKYNAQGIFMGYFDPHIFTDAKVDRFGVEMGLEFVMMSDLFLRVGAFRNATIPELPLKGRGYGAGLGWIAPRISLDYGIKRATEPVATITHVIGATIYF